MGHAPRTLASARGALPWLAVFLLVGVALRWPAMEAGFRGDDYVQLAALRGDFPAPRQPWDLFRFDGATPAQARALIDDGYHPWWSAPDLRLSMWRPLSSLLIAADHALWGPSPFAHHAHSMLWWVALCAVAAWVLRGLLPPRAALLATAVFVLEEAHAIPIAWLANRSALVASTFALLALGLHLRSDEGNDEGNGDDAAHPKWSRAGSVAAAALALAAGEYALSMLTYLWVHALLGTDRPLARRMRAAAPSLACACAYLVLRSATGHGTASSAFYVGPADDPIAFMIAAARRLPVLYGDALLGIPASLWNGEAPMRHEVLQLVGVERFRSLPPWQAIQSGLGMLALALGQLAVRRLSRHAPDEGRRRTLRVLWLGTLLSALPAAGSLPDDRLLIGTGFGAATIVGLLSARLLERIGRRPGVAAIGLLGLVAAIHVGLAATRGRLQTVQFARSSHSLRAWCLAAELPDAATAAQTDAYLVSAGDFTTAANLPWVRAAHGASRPRSYRRLSGATHAHQLLRTGDRTLELTVLSKNIRHAFTGSLYRSLRHPLRRGDRFTLRGMQVEILAVTADNPYRLRFTFDRSLDDPRLLLLQASREGVVPLPPPAIGESRLLIRPQSARR